DLQLHRDAGVQELTAAEEHSGGTQVTRLRSLPVVLAGNAETHGECEAEAWRACRGTHGAIRYARADTAGRCRKARGNAGSRTCPLVTRQTAPGWGSVRRLARLLRRWFLCRDDPGYPL